LQMDAGQFDKAAETIQEALRRISRDRDLGEDDRKEYAATLRYTLSQVYMEFDQVDKACDELQALLKEYPDNPGYNNDLGYIWADHNQNLDEAERLIRKALDEDRKQRQKEGGEGRAAEDRDNP